MPLTIPSASSLKSLPFVATKYLSASAVSSPPFPSSSASTFSTKGVLLFVVTLSSHTDTRAYPCRSREKALELATRFIASTTKDVAQPAPAK